MARCQLPVRMSTRLAPACPRRILLFYKHTPTGTSRSLPWRGKDVNPGPRGKLRARRFGAARSSVIQDTRILQCQERESRELSPPGWEKGYLEDTSAPLERIS